MKKTETDATPEGRRLKPGEFPRAITRNEFGRHYWPEAREAELRAAARPRLRKPSERR